VNISLTENDVQLFEMLKQLAEQLPNKTEVVTSIEEMKHEAGKPSFAEKYNKFVQSVANHITIFAPFIPTLTAFLTR
jgi:Tfp pilus assembly protein PilO